MPDNCRAVYLYSIWYFAYIVTADCLYAVLGWFWPLHCHWLWRCAWCITGSALRVRTAPESPD